MEERKHLQLNDVEAYKMAFNLSNYIWSKVEQWDYFSKQTVGIQIVKAVDSISSNIAEGFGRYGKKEKIQFSGTPEGLYTNVWIGMKSVKSENCYCKRSMNTPS